MDHWGGGSWSGFGQWKLRWGHLYLWIQARSLELWSPGIRVIRLPTWIWNIFISNLLELSRFHNFFYVYTCAFIFHELVGKYMQYGTTVYTSTVHTNIEHMNEIWCWKQDIMVTWNLFQPVCGPDCFEPFLYPPSIRGWMGCWFWGLLCDGSRSCQEDNFCGFCGAIPQWVWIQVDKLE